MAGGNFLTGLFTYSIEGIQPRIVHLEEPIKIVGMAVNTNLKRVYRDVPALGKRFSDYKKAHEIPCKKQPWGFAAVSKDFVEQQGTFTYLMGDVVTSLEAVPTNLVTFEIPAIQYAVFPVRPRNKLGWPFAIADAKRYALGVWLPGSGYAPAGGIADFEYHDERSLRERNPEIDLYLAIKEKD